MNTKKYPITRPLAKEVFDFHETENWESPWLKIVVKYPELENHRGNLILFFDDNSESIPYVCVKESTL